jgi:hypothetical protein
MIFFADLSDIRLQRVAANITGQNKCANISGRLISTGFESILNCFFNFKINQILVLDSNESD